MDHFLTPCILPSQCDSLFVVLQHVDPNQLLYMLKAGASTHKIKE